MLLHKKHNAQLAVEVVSSFICITVFFLFSFFFFFFFLSNHPTRSNRLPLRLTLSAY
jgi:hypothetical protein